MIRMSLRVKVLGTFLTLIVSLHLSLSFFVLDRSKREADTLADSQLENGARVFERLILDREEQLLSSVKVLVSDFGLRGAVATGDRATVASALENHGERIRADLTFFMDLDGVLGARSPLEAHLDPDRGAMQRLLSEAKASGQAAGTAVVSGRPYQIVLAPVKAPRTIGWVGMGFELDRELAQELRDLTDLEVSFWALRDNAPLESFELRASTLSVSDRAKVLRGVQLGALRTQVSKPFLLADSDWISFPLILHSGAGEQVGAALQTSYTKVMSSYRAQRSELISFFALGLALALAGTIPLARRLTNPILALAAGARAISAGDLSAEVDASDSADEIGELARSFRVMQAAVSEREQEIVHQSLHDPLTDLPNRIAVADALSQAIHDHDDLAVVILDTTRLKDVNGNLGTAVGDEALVQTAQRLRDCEEIEWVAHLGAGDFLALLPFEDEAQIVPAVSAIIEMLERPIQIRGAKVSLSFLAGLAKAPQDGESTDALMQRAELALGLSKSQANSISSYVPGLEEANHRRVGILIALERALECGDLELHYQPKVEIESRRVIGAEALIRWTHAEMGRMNPEEFILLAEQSGFIGRVSDWVLKEAIGQAAVWAQAGLELCISINLSAHDAAEESLPEKILGVLANAGATPDQIQIEVTESAVMKNPERAAALLQRVRDVGVRISIDDFGTGHSSLAQLRTLPSDELKIDQAFIRELRLGTPDEAIVRTSIDLGHSLGLKVVAEGVEDSGVLRLLNTLGCDIAQGYGLGRPMPASEFPTWLEAFNKETSSGQENDETPGDREGLASER